jgi:hypothetical protein
MAHFRGEVKGRRGGVSSRLGDKVSGLETTCNSWSEGVEVRASHDRGRERDSFEIYMTPGSGSGSSQFLGTVEEGRFIPSLYLKELVLSNEINEAERDMLNHYRAIENREEV